MNDANVEGLIRWRPHNVQVRCVWSNTKRLLARGFPIRHLQGIARKGSGTKELKDDNPTKGHKMECRVTTTTKRHHAIDNKLTNILVNCTNQYIPSTINRRVKKGTRSNK